MLEKQSAIFLVQQFNLVKGLGNAVLHPIDTLNNCFSRGRSCEAGLKLLRAWVDQRVEQNHEEKTLRG